MAGGISNVPSALSSAELYDPATRSWSLTTPMNAASYRSPPPSSPTGTCLSPAFPTRHQRCTTPSTPPGPTRVPFPPGEDATATLLGDGEVLVAGGTTPAAALYDPATNSWSATGDMVTTQQGPTATLLDDGRVLVAGGVDPKQFAPLATSETYDPATGMWS